jgi:Xaa-Pro dipeptidase
MTTELPAMVFSPTEMSRRRDELDVALEAAGVQHAIVYGANRAGSGVQWLTGWPVTREALVVHSVAAVGAPDSLFVQFYNHLPQARQLAVDACVAWAGPRSMHTATEELVRRGVGAGSAIGVIGPLPFAPYQALLGVCDRVVDLNPAYTRLRMRKSAEELGWLRVAAGMTDASCAALRDGAVPGATDHELLALVEGSYLAAGGANYIHYLSMTSMAAPQQCVPQQWATGRVLHTGDVLSCELSTSYGVDYPGQLLRTFTVAAEPTPLFRELHGVADEALTRMERRLAPGCTPADLVAEADVIEEAGFTTVDDLVHGLGGGYLPPVFGSRSRTLEPLPSIVFTEGMTVVVQPNVTTTDGSAGVQTGDMLHVTATGCERLHAFPRGLARTA